MENSFCVLQTWGCVNEWNFHLCITMPLRLLGMYELHRAVFTDQRSRSPVLFPASVSYSFLSYGSRVIVGFVGNVTSVTHIPKETRNARCVLTGYIVHLIRLCVTPVKFFTKVQYQSKFWTHQTTYICFSWSSKRLEFLNL